MHPSEKTTYGFLFLLHLANAFDMGYVKVNEIIEQEKISLKYLENIVSKLRVAGLVTAKKGATGGYKLNRLPEKIKLIEIYECLNGPLKEDTMPGENAYKKVVADLWTDIRNQVFRYLSERTLEDLYVQFKKNQNLLNNCRSGGFYF